MAELKGTNTHSNLIEAFARDAQVHRSYLYFARIAEIEGYGDVATLFRDLAELEEQFSAGHLDFLKRAGDPVTGAAIGETEKNLAAAIEVENRETVDALPRMVRTAHAEGFPDIANWFETLAWSKELHEARFREALAATTGVDAGESDV